MYIKLLGENENGFPLDCTVGKVYEIKEFHEDDVLGFYDDCLERNYLFSLDSAKCVGEWQVVDKEGNVL